MALHTTFLKWWLYVATTCAGAYFAYQFGVFHEIYEKDISKLSFVIMAGFVIMTTWCGIKTFLVSRAMNRFIHLENNLGVGAGNMAFSRWTERAILQEENGWFACSKFEQIGYIGTLIGFIIMLAGFANIDPSQLKSLQAFIITLGAGMMTALYTTLVGLTCSHLLSYQYHNLGQAIRKLTDE